MQSMPENFLLDKLKTEESLSFELLYRLYYPSIASYITQNLGNNEDAEDIFQETIIILVQKVRQPDFVLTSSLKTYLYAVAKNLWLKRLRDNKIRFEDVELCLTAHNIKTEIIEFETEMSNEEKVGNWLQKITRNCQEILKALFFYKVPMDTLMVKMGWKNKHTASNQKHKCIQQMKRVKEKNIFTRLG
jgi:RNA polymerase sigma factor (sigma-70 family)